MALEARAAVVGLGEPVALDHRAHRAVEHEDAAARGSRGGCLGVCCMLLGVGPTGLRGERRDDAEARRTCVAAGDLARLDFEAGAREQAPQRRRGEPGVDVAVGGRTSPLVVGIERDDDERCRRAGARARPRRRHARGDSTCVST